MLWTLDTSCERNYFVVRWTIVNKITLYSWYKTIKLMKIWRQMLLRNTAWVRVIQDVSGFFSLFLVQIVLRYLALAKPLKSVKPEAFSDGFMINSQPLKGKVETRVRIFNIRSNVTWTMDHWEVNKLKQPTIKFSLQIQYDAQAPALHCTKASYILYV